MVHLVAVYYILEVSIVTGQDHISHTVPSIEDIQREAQSVYSGALFLAQDFSEYHLDKAGHVTEQTQEPPG